MKIEFYSMPGCIYCSKSKELLRNEIKNKTVVIKPYTEAPRHVRGFPYFQANKKSFSGYPGTVSNLFRSLGMNGGTVSRSMKPKRSVKPKNKWNEFLKKHSGKNLSKAQLKKMYYKL